MAVCNAHDLGALALLGFLATCRPLFGRNKRARPQSIPAKSNPPASLRCCASVSNKFSITPDFTQFWNRRCAVWYGPYRGGRSFHGAPVRKTNTPLNIVRRSLHGRPRPSSRIGSSGKMVATNFHCSSVRSIHNYLYTNGCLRAIKSTVYEMACRVRFSSNSWRAKHLVNPDWVNCRLGYNGRRYFAICWSD